MTKTDPYQWMAETPEPIEPTPEQIEARRKYYIRQSRAKSGRKEDSSFQIVAFCGLVFALFVVVASAVMILKEMR